MTPDPRSALWSLLAMGLPIAGCAAAVEDEGDGGGSRGDGEAAVAACGAYAQKYADCYAAVHSEPERGYLNALSYCINYLGHGDIHGSDCRAAIEDLYACLGALECEELLGEDVGGDSTTGPGDDTGAGDNMDPCAAQHTVIDNAC